MILNFWFQLYAFSFGTKLLEARSMCIWYRLSVPPMEHLTPYHQFLVNTGKGLSIQGSCSFIFFCIHPYCSFLSVLWDCDYWTFLDGYHSVQLLGTPRSAGHRDGTQYSSDTHWASSPNRCCVDRRGAGRYPETPVWLPGAHMCVPHPQNGMGAQPIALASAQFPWSKRATIPR